jgi:tripartite-type tricarboxylate transporter receptor subunit TctC
LFGPAKLPPDLLRTWSDAARAAVQSPDVRRRIEAEGATPVGNSPQEFAQFVVTDIARWREVVKFSGAKPE